MNQPPELNRIVDVKDIIHATQQIYKHAEEIRSAYEHLMARYETLSTENAELRSASAKVTVEDAASNKLGHKRRKTDESIVINESVASNDPLNEAIRDISSCVEDEFIESTPKPDATRKNISKKILTFRSPNKRLEVKVEKFDDSKDSKDEESFDAHKLKVEKSPDSPLKSVENHSITGKENRQKVSTRWISNAMVSPTRVNRSGFIKAISPKGVARLSLSKPYKQSLLDFAKKPTKDTEMDSCAETFFDGTPRKPVADSKGKFLRQQCLEACVNSSKDSDDENVFSFKSTTTSTAKPSKRPSTSPPSVKLEPQEREVKESAAASSTATTSHNQSLTESCGSSVVALSGEKPEVIVIEESQPLFDDCSETFCDRMELNIQAVESMASELKINDNENIVANHNMACRQCKLFMESNPHLTMAQKLAMLDNCKYPTRPDTDPEFWNPRFQPTPESQKQETLIDDRWATRKRKS